MFRRALIVLALVFGWVGQALAQPKPCDADTSPGGAITTGASPGTGEAAHDMSAVRARERQGLVPDTVRLKRELEAAQAELTSEMSRLKTVAHGSSDMADIETRAKITLANVQNLSVRIQPPGSARPVSFAQIGGDEVRGDYNKAIKRGLDIICELLRWLIQGDHHHYYRVRWQNQVGDMLAVNTIGYFYGPNDGQYAFDSFTFGNGQAPAENEGDWQSGHYVTAGVLAPLSGQTTPFGNAAWSGRVAVAELEGNPNAEVFGLSVGEFLSPDILDCQLGGSWRVREGKDHMDWNCLADGDELRWQDDRGRHLLDFIRPGDVWVSPTVRSLAESGTTQAVIGGGSVTYAFPGVSYKRDPHRSPIPAYTLSLSGMACSQPGYRLSAVALEARIPLFGVNRYSTPTYLTARYDTMNELTLTLDFPLTHANYSK